MKRKNKIDKFKNDKKELIMRLWQGHTQFCRIGSYFKDVLLIKCNCP